MSTPFAQLAVLGSTSNFAVTAALTRSNSAASDQTAYNLVVLTDTDSSSSEPTDTQANSPIDDTIFYEEVADPRKRKSPGSASLSKPKRRSIPAGEKESPVEQPGPVESAPSANSELPYGYRNLNRCSAALRDLVCRYRDSVNFPTKLIAEKPKPIRGKELLFSDHQEQQSAWELCVAAAHLDNSVPYYFHLCYPQHPLSLLRRHQEPLKFFSRNYAVAHADESEGFDRLILVIEHFAVLWQNKEAMEIFASYDRAAPEAEQLKTLSNCLDRLAQLYQQSQLGLPMETSVEGVTVRREQWPTHFNSFAVNLPDIIQWLFKRLYLSQKSIEFNHTDSKTFETTYEDLFKRMCLSNTTNNPYGHVPIAYGTAVPLMDGTHLQRYRESYPIPTQYAWPSRRHFPTGTNKEFWFQEANIIGTLVHQTVSQHEKLLSFKQKYPWESPPAFVHKVSLNKLAPPNGINVIHIGDRNVSFLSSRANQSAITTTWMHPFDLVSVLLLDEINFTFVHAIHVQCGFHELVSIPEDLNRDNNAYSESLLALRIKKIKHLHAILPKKILDAIATAHRVAARIGIPVMMLSTLQPYGILDGYHTRGVNSAINEVICEVNRAVIRYVCQPQPLVTLVHLVDIWKELNGRLQPGATPYSPKATLNYYYNFEAKDGYGILLKPKGVDLWRDLFKRELDAALAAFTNHYDQWSPQHFNDEIHPLKSKIGQMIQLTVPPPHSYISEALTSTVPTNSFLQNHWQPLVPPTARKEPVSPQLLQKLSTTQSFMPTTSFMPDVSASSSTAPLLSAIEPTVLAALIRQLQTSQGLNLLQSKGLQLGPVQPAEIEEIPVETAAQGLNLLQSKGLQLGPVQPAEIEEIPVETAAPGTSNGALKPLPRRLIKLRNPPLIIRYPDPAVPRRADRSLDMTHTNVGNIPIPPELQLLEMYFFDRKDDSLLRDSNDWTQAQRAALVTLRQLGSLDFSEIPCMPLHLKYFHCLEIWKVYLETLLPKQKSFTIDNAIWQRANFSRTLMITLQPEFMKRPQSFSNDRYFVNDKHQPMLHAVLRRLVYFEQFSENPPRRSTRRQFIQDFVDFEPNLQLPIDQVKPGPVQLLPTEAMLLIWGQFASYYNARHNQLLTETQWLDAYQMALDYVNVQFPDVTPYPFPLL